MNEDTQKVYLIGPLADFQQRFPDHDFDHARKSLDGFQAVIEVEATDADLDEFIGLGFEVLDHAEALAYLNAADKIGVWRHEEPATPPPPPPPADPEPEPEPDPAVL